MCGVREGSSVDITIEAIGWWVHEVHITLSLLRYMFTLKS